MAENKYDAIVVGSGISGGWAAKELTEKGLKVLMLERGRNIEHIKDYTSAAKAPWEFPHAGGRTQKMIEDYPVLKRDYPLNEMNLDFTSPNSYNFGGNLNALNGVNYSRSLEQNLGSTFYLGARCYIGAEYFFAPKMSIGLEVGYSLAMATNSDASRIDETFSVTDLKEVQVETKLKRNEGLSTYGLSLDNANAGLNLFLYF